MTDITYDAAQILNIPMNPDENDAGASTIRDYLVSLLGAVWYAGEGFSGKRPFGNSGWTGDLYEPLVKAGIIPGRMDEDGYIDDWDPRDGYAAIAAAIEGLRAAPEAGGVSR
jgi:hypothetical protein